MPLEYNLLGLRDRLAGDKRGYPCPAFWDYARKWSNTVILGVDAHAPWDLSDQVVWERGKRDVLGLGYQLTEQLSMEV